MTRRSGRHCSSIRRTLHKITIAPGQTGSVHIAGTFIANPAFHYLLWKVDYTNALAETDESNNEYTMLDARSFNRVNFGPPNPILAGTTTVLDPGVEFCRGECDGFLECVIERDVGTGKAGRPVEYRSEQLSRSDSGTGEKKPDDRRAGGGDGHRRKTQTAVDGAIPAGSRKLGDQPGPGARDAENKTGPSGNPNCHHCAETRGWPTARKSGRLKY